MSPGSSLSLHDFFYHPRYSPRSLRLRPISIARVGSTPRLERETSVSREQIGGGQWGPVCLRVVVIQI